MASTYSTLLGVQLPATDEQAGVWGNSTNINFGKIIEQAIAGATVVDLTSAGGTFTPNDIDGTPSQSRSAILRFTGTPGATTNIVVPTKAKVYTVRNDSDANIRVKTSAQVTYVELEPNTATIMFCDGTDVLPGIYENAVAILPVSGGGTGVATFTAGFVKSPGGTAALITEPTIDLATESGNSLPVANGGIGIGVIPTGCAVLGNGTSPFSYAVGTTNGDYLMWNGSTWTGSPGAGGTTVSSFNTRTGAVSPVQADYQAYYALRGGSNASGTWGIDISGSTPTATACTYATNITLTSGRNVEGTRTVSTSKPTSAVTGNLWYRYQ